MRVQTERAGRCINIWTAIPSAPFYKLIRACSPSDRLCRREKLKGRRSCSEMLNSRIHRKPIPQGLEERKKKSGTPVTLVNGRRSLLKSAPGDTFSWPYVDTAHLMARTSFCSREIKNFGIQDTQEMLHTLRHSPLSVDSRT